MPNEKYYVSIINNGTRAIYIKDAEARQQIEDIKNGITGGLRYIGKSSVKLEEDIDGPWTIDGIVYDCYYFYVVPSGQAGAAFYLRTPIFDELVTSGSTETKYYAFALSKNQSTSSNIPNILYIQNDIVIHLGTTLYKKENGEFIDAGGSSGISIDNLNQVHNVTSGATELVIGAVAFYVDNSGSTPKELEYVFGITGWSEFGSTGSLKALAFKNNASGSYTPSGSVSVSINSLTGSESKKLATTSIKGVSGTQTVHDTPTLNKSEIGSVSNWSAGSLPSMTYNEGTETLTFGTGTLPSLTVTSTQVGTSLTDGTEKTFATANNDYTVVATGKTTNADDNGDSVVTTSPSGGTASGSFSGDAATITVS